MPEMTCRKRNPPTRVMEMYIGTVTVENSMGELVMVSQSRLTLCDPVDCSPPGSPVHGILQARILEWAAMPSSGRTAQRTTIRSSNLALGYTSEENHNSKRYKPPSIHCSTIYNSQDMKAS